MKMEAALPKTEYMEVMPIAWTQEEEEDDDAEYPQTFHESDDENPPDVADRRGRGAGGRGGGIKILKTSYCGSVSMRGNEENAVQKTGTSERESEFEKIKERDPRGGRRVITGGLRHRCFLNNCCGETRGETRQGEEERGHRGETMSSGRENDIEIVIINPDNDDSDQKTNISDDDSARGCVMRQRTSPPTPVTPHPPPATHTLPPCHCIPQQSYPATHPCQGHHPPLYPCSPCLQCHKQGTAFPYHKHCFRYIPCQIPCPYLCQSLQHPRNHPATPHNRGNVIQAIQDTPADVPTQEKRPRSSSFSKDYITSLAFLARVNHVARVLADRSLALKDLPQCPSPAMCLLLPQQRQESPPQDSHRHQDSCTHDLQRLQETLALCTGVGKGEVTQDLRQYCKSLLLAVLCPRSPPHEVRLVENSIKELEGRAYGDHKPSQVKYCWRLASSLCLILERLDCVPSAQ